MRNHRVYIQKLLQAGTSIVLDKAASLHLAKVLRVKLETPLVLFNGDGFSYLAKVIAIEKNSVTAHVLEQIVIANESPLDLHLFQGVSRGDKMDLTLQKGVELGIKQFTPIITERCGVKLDAKRWQKKLEHWQKVIESACEQSGRNIIPKLNPALQWNDALKQFSLSSFFLEPSASASFKQLKTPELSQEIQLWVGPEGGFSEHELIQIKQVGATPVRLGPRILRTETAALAAVASINTLWGDF